MVAQYQNGNSTGLDKYSGKALIRVLKTQRFSWWMTTLLYTFPGPWPAIRSCRKRIWCICSYRRKRCGCWRRTMWGCRFKRLSTLLFCLAG